MKYLFIFIIFLHIKAFALIDESSEKKLKSKIISSIIKNLSMDKEVVVFTDDKDIKDDLLISSVENCKDANLIILKDKEKLNKDCLKTSIFLLDYNLLEHIESSFGAFFFKKGRANIVFIEPRLKKDKIKLSAKLTPYIEEKIW